MCQCFQPCISAGPCCGARGVAVHLSSIAAACPQPSWQHRCKGVLPSMLWQSALPPFVARRPTITGSSCIAAMCIAVAPYWLWQSGCADPSSSMLFTCSQLKTVTKSLCLCSGMDSATAAPASQSTRAACEGIWQEGADPSISSIHDCSM